MTMPSIILAPIKITDASGEVTFGDVLQITPKSTSKTFSGAGAGNTGDFMNVLNVISLTNTFDPDANDSNNQGNN
jgi:spore germination protein PF